MPVDLTETDMDLLELAAVQVPWYMVCGEFHSRYGSPESLVARLFALREVGLLTIRGEEPVTAAALLADAHEHDCYEDLEASREPRWELLATDAGYTAIEARLGPQ